MKNLIKIVAAAILVLLACDIYSQGEVFPLPEKAKNQIQIFDQASALTLTGDYRRVWDKDPCDFANYAHYWVSTEVGHPTGLDIIPMNTGLDTAGYYIPVGYVLLESNPEIDRNTAELIDFEDLMLSRRLLGFQPNREIVKVYHQPGCYRFEVHRVYFQYGLDDDNRGYMKIITVPQYIQGIYVYKKTI